MAVCLLMLLSCIVSTTLTADAAVISDQSWNELERLDVCPEIDSPSVAETCSLCPAALPGVSVWRCCHDPRAFEDCSAAVDATLENAVDKRRTKYFLGKKRGVKYFLGKRSPLGEALQPLYSREWLARELQRPREDGVIDKRVKYFLG